MQQRLHGCRGNNVVAGAHKADQNFRVRVHVTCDDPHTAAALEFQGVQAAVPDGGAESAVLISDVQILQFRNHAFNDAADFIRFYGQGVKLAAAQLFNRVIALQEHLTHQRDQFGRIQQSCLCGAEYLSVRGAGGLIREIHPEEPAADAVDVLAFHLLAEIAVRVVQRENAAVGIYRDGRIQRFRPVVFEPCGKQPKHVSRHKLSSFASGRDRIQNGLRDGRTFRKRLWPETSFKTEACPVFGAALSGQADLGQGSALNIHLGVELIAAEHRVKVFAEIEGENLFHGLAVDFGAVAFHAIQLFPHDMAFPYGVQGQPQQVPLINLAADELECSAVFQIKRTVCDIQINSVLVCTDNHVAAL